MPMKRPSILGALFICTFVIAAMVWSQPAQATLLVLEDDNSSAEIDPESSAGMYTWLVDGVDHMFQQWFWYRVNDDDEMAEESIDNLSLGFHGTFDTNGDSDDDTAFMRFEGDDFDIEIRFVLDGGQSGSGTADIAEQISINNTGDSLLDITFFQYSDFDLAETLDDDELVFVNANAVRQSDALTTVSETVITPSADHYEGDIFDDTLVKLEDSSIDDLNDSPGVGVTIGPDDVTWAYQWNITLAPGGTFQISKDKQISRIPEPASLMLLGLGCVGLGLVRRRRR